MSIGCQWAILYGGRLYRGFVNSAVSGCFWLFAPKFWEVVRTSNCSFVPAVFLYICSLILIGKFTYSSSIFPIKLWICKFLFSEICVPVYAHAIVYALCFKFDSTGKANCVQIFGNDAIFPPMNCSQICRKF